MLGHFDKKSKIPRSPNSMLKSVIIGRSEVLYVTYLLLTLLSTATYSQAKQNFPCDQH